MNRKVDVRKKYTREAKKMDITIVELKELDAYLTLKEIKEVTQPYYMYINGELVKKMDNNFTLLEYTPLHENYNVRVYIDDKLNILEYYFDITDGNEIEDGIPYYDDLYLDVVFYQECATKSSTYINLEDRNDLSDALKKGAINKEKYDFAFKIADSVMKELKNKTNRFVNRGIEDYLKYRKNII
ncbi:hypothetical conserved protein [Clostridium sp. CAG:571]|jgi:predicted RNA-binding protein associated with RNAse of E/G family|nr:hypothetical conserved protein [Clostridium sp. CAG:571]HJJ06890.1 DUF402 domain-containing protein [Clostridiaceae bacterium]